MVYCDRCAGYRPAAGGGGIPGAMPPGCSIRLRQSFPHLSYLDEEGDPAELNTKNDCSFFVAGEHPMLIRTRRFNQRLSITGWSLIGGMLLVLFYRLS